jgi:hypothetical protein
VLLRRNHGDLAGCSGITGLLLQEGLCLCGLMEGPEDQLLSCVEGLATDRCHRRLNVIREDRVVDRRFSNWAFCELPATASQIGIDRLPLSFAAIISQKL